MDTVKWGKASCTVDVASVAPRTLRNKSREESAATYEALKTVAGMSKTGCIVLYRSNETRFEQMHLRHPVLRSTEFDVFYGVDCKFVPGPIRRDFTITSDSSQQELKGGMVCISRFHS
jgi:hypothetical protein